MSDHTKYLSVEAVRAMAAARVEMDKNMTDEEKEEKREEDAFWAACKNGKDGDPCPGGRARIMPDGERRWQCNCSFKCTKEAGYEF